MRHRTMLFALSSITGPPLREEGEVNEKQAVASSLRENVLFQENLNIEVFIGLDKP